MTGSVFYVSSSQELQAAYLTLSKSGGGTIFLKDMDTRYTIGLDGTNAGAGAVKITSANANDPTVIGRINMTGVKNVTIDNIEMNSTGIVRAEWINDLTVAKSSGVTITNSTFTGNATGPYNGVKMETLGHIRWSDNVTFSENTVSNYYHGLSLQESTNLKVTGNDISQMQGDGLRMAGVQNVQISDNYFHDFFGTPQNFNHNDMIQMWSPNAKIVSANVTISDNVFNSGSGSATQSILIGNEQLRTNPDHIYQNIKITNNLIYNGQSNGIQVNGTNGLVVSDNTLLWNKDSLIDTGSSSINSAPRILVRGSTKALVEDNISSNTIATKGDVVVKNNVVLSYSDPNSPTYVGKHFVNALEGGAADIRDLRMVPDSPWNGKLGASDSWAVTKSTDGSVDAVIRSQISTADAATYTFDGSLSLDADGYANESFYKYVWNFEDGSKLEGMKVTKTFSSTGEQDVKLTIFKNGVKMDEVTRQVELAEKDLLKIDFDANTSGTARLAAGAVFVDESSHDSKLINYETSNAVQGAPGEGYAYRIGGTDKLSIARGNEQIHGLHSFRLEFDIGLVKAGASGVFLDFPKVMRAHVNPEGVVKYTFTTNEGTFTMTSAKPVLTGTGMHRIEFAYDDSVNKLAMYANGKEVASTVASGMTSPKAGYALTFGNTWGKSVAAKIDNIEMDLDSGLSGSGTTTAVKTAVGYSSATAEAAGVESVSETAEGSGEVRTMAAVKSASASAGTDSGSDAEADTEATPATVTGSPAPTTSGVSGPALASPHGGRGIEEALDRMADKAPANDVAASRLAQILDRLGYPREGAQETGKPAAMLHDLIPTTRVLSESSAFEDEDQDEDEEIDA